MKKMTDLRRARGLIQQAYSKIINRFGTESEVLGMLTEALALIKAADVPGGVVEVEADLPAADPQPEATTSGAGSVEVEQETSTDAEPPRRTRRGMGRKK